MLGVFFSRSPPYLGTGYLTEPGADHLAKLVGQQAPQILLSPFAPALQL